MSFNDTSITTRTTDSNLVLLCSGSIVGTGAYANFNFASSDQTSLYRYAHQFLYTTGLVNTYFGVKTGTVTTSNLVSGTDYSIDSDPISGNTRIKKFKKHYNTR